MPPITCSLSSFISTFLSSSYLISKPPYRTEPASLGLGLVCEEITGWKGEEGGGGREGGGEGKNTYSYLLNTTNTTMVSYPPFLFLLSYSQKKKKGKKQGGDVEEGGTGGMGCDSNHGNTGFHVRAIVFPPHPVPTASPSLSLSKRHSYSVLS